MRKNMVLPKVSLITCVLILLLSPCKWVHAQTYFPVKVDNHWGLMDKEGKIVHSPQYDALSNFEAFGYALVQKEGKVGILNQQGKTILPIIYNDIKVIDSTLFSIFEEKGWALINQAGDRIIDGAFQEIKSLNKDFLAIRNELGWGIASVKKGVLINPAFEKVTLASPELVIVSNNQKKGVIATNGQILVHPLYDEVLILKDGLFLVRQNSHWGVLNQHGERLSEIRYKSFDFLSDHFLKLYSFEELHLFSIPCKRVIAKEKLSTFLPLSSTYVMVKNQRKMGIVDFCGNRVLAERYDEVLWFKDGLFRVNLNGNWGLVKPKDELFTELKYDYISPLQGKLALYRKEGKFGVLNYQGEEVIKAEYQRIELEGSTAKAYTADENPQKESLDLIKFDKEGRLIGDARFNQHFSVRIGKKNSQEHSNSKEQSNYILDDFEWFYESNSDRWGLRNIVDGSLKISASFEEIEVLSDLGLSLVGLPSSQDFEFERTTIRISKLYGLVDNQQGILLGKLQFRHIFLEDFRAGQTYARCILEDGKYGLINRNGQLLEQTYTYIGPFQDGVARCAQGGMLNAGMNHAYPIDQLYEYLLAWQSPFILVDDNTYDELLLNKGVVYCEDCTWSYIGPDANSIGKESFDYAMDMVNQVGMVHRDGKWGLFGNTGDLIIPCAYDDLAFLENTNNRIVKLYVRKTRYGLIDTLGKLTINAVFDEVGAIREGRLAVMKNGKWGFADQDGNLVINCQYEEVKSFYEGLAAVYKDRRWSYIDRKGTERIPARFKKVGDFQHGFAWVEEQNSVGFIDTTGKYFIQPQFKEARTFFRGVAIVRSEGLYGLINTDGEYLTKPRFQSISNFDNNGLAIVQLGKGGDRYGMINLNGEVITSVAYRSIEPFSEGLAVVRNNDAYGYINTKGDLVIPFKFSKAASFSEGRAAVYLNGDCGFIDITGRKITEYQFSRCQDFEDGRAVVYRGMRKAGLVDRDGNMVLTPSVNQLLNFSEGRGLVRDNEYRFYYITEEADVYQGYYEKATEFQNGIAVIKMNERWGIINRNGITLVRPKYSRIEDFENGYAKVEIDGFSGLSRIDGRMIVKPGFEYISYAGEGLFRVEQGDKIGYFDQQGRWIWELQN